MKYRHYAPKAKLMIVEGDLRDEILRYVRLRMRLTGRGIRSVLLPPVRHCRSIIMG